MQGHKLHPHYVEVLVLSQQNLRSGGVIILLARPSALLELPIPLVYFNSVYLFLFRMS